MPHVRFTASAVEAVQLLVIASCCTAKRPANEARRKILTFSQAIVVTARGDNVPAGISCSVPIEKL